MQRRRHLMLLVLIPTLTILIFLSFKVSKHSKPKRTVGRVIEYKSSMGRIQPIWAHPEMLQLIDSFQIGALFKNATFNVKEYSMDGITVIMVKSGRITYSQPPVNEMSFERDRRGAFLELLSLALREMERRGKLTDFHLLLSVKDCCLFTDNYPIFSVTRCQNSTHLPITQLNAARDGPLKNWNRRMRRGRGLLAIKYPPWEERRDVAVFRGSLAPIWSFTERGEVGLTRVTQANWRWVGRGILAHLANQTNLLNVQLRHVKHFIPSFPFPEASLEELSMEEQAGTFKYTVVVEGNCGWADRLKTFLSLGAVIFLQETPCNEHYTLLLTPWRHYIPVKGDLSDLIERIQWARDNMERAKEISEEGRRFADLFLTESALISWTVSLVEAYAEAYREHVMI